MALPETSHMANREMTKEIREQHHAKIIAAMEALGEDIGENIAIRAKMDYHAVMRRMKELVEVGKIYNTLKTGLTSKNRKANKYAIRTETTRIPEKEHHYLENETTGADFANVLIQKGENSKREKENIISQRLEQIDLFKI